MINAPDQDWLDRLTRDGVAAFVVEGDVSVRTDRPLYPGSSLPDAELVPPAEFVAMTGPCEMCDGDGVDGSHNAALYYADQGRISNCPDCHGDGRKRVRVVKADDCECRSCLYGATIHDPFQDDTGLMVIVKVVPRDDGRFAVVCTLDPEVQP